MKPFQSFGTVLMIACFVSVSFSSLAQSGDKKAVPAKEEVAAIAAEYNYSGDNYSFDVFRFPGKIEILVKDKAGKDVANSLKLEGVIGILYADGTQEEKPLVSMGKNKLGITTSGKTISDMRMMVDVDGDQMITGYNVASGKSHQDTH
jgi:hypothetical protein